MSFLQALANQCSKAGSFGSSTDIPDLEVKESRQGSMAADGGPWTVASVDHLKGLSADRSSVPAKGISFFWAVAFIVPIVSSVDSCVDLWTCGLTLHFSLTLTHLCCVLWCCRLSVLSGSMPYEASSPPHFLTRVPHKSASTEKNTRGNAPYDK